MYEENFELQEIIKKKNVKPNLTDLTNDKMYVKIFGTSNEVGNNLEYDYFI